MAAGAARPRPVRVRLHAAGVDCGAARDDGASPILAAAKHGHLDAVRCLADECGVRRDALNHAAEPRRRAAARRGHAEVVAFLDARSAERARERAQGEGARRAAARAHFARLATREAGRRGGRRRARAGAGAAGAGAAAPPGLSRLVSREGRDAVVAWSALRPAGAAEAGAAAAGAAAPAAVLEAAASYVCPITQDVMEHPTAIGGSRFRYERDALAQWVAVHGTVPHPPHPVRATLDDLRPDDALRDEIPSVAPRARFARRAGGARARAAGAARRCRVGTRPSPAAAAAAGRAPSTRRRARGGARLGSPARPRGRLEHLSSHVA